MAPFIAASVNEAISASRPARRANSSMPSMQERVLSQSNTPRQISGALPSQGKLHDLSDGRQRLNFCERSFRQRRGNANQRNCFRLVVGISDLHPRDINILAAKNATEGA